MSIIIRETKQSTRKTRIFGGKVYKISTRHMESGGKKWTEHFIANEKKVLHNQGYSVRITKFRQDEKLVYEIWIRKI